MNWEKTILHIRGNDGYKKLLHKSYLEADLVKNVKRFRASKEFRLTQKLLNEYTPTSKNILDIGAGNGISTISFALYGYEVFAVEPDTSDTVGLGAIKQLIDFFLLKNVHLINAYAEQLPFQEETFDVIHARQAMHHAQNLSIFLKESFRVLKKGGYLFTIRDHVIFDSRDKERFLENHPLQKFYGGENAYTPCEYKQAMRDAGFEVIKEFKFFDTPINYYPMKIFSINRSRWIQKFLQILPSKLFRYLPKNIKNKLIPIDEKYISGRLYSYICKKN